MAELTLDNLVMLGELLIGGIVFTGILVFLLQRSAAGEARKRDRLTEELAAKFGLKLRIKSEAPGPKMVNREVSSSVADGVYAGRPVLIGFSLHPRGKGSTYTLFSVVAKLRPTDFYLWVCRRMDMALAHPMFSIHRIDSTKYETGDAAFDSKLYAFTKQPSIAAPLLSPDLRQQIIELFSDGRTVELISETNPWPGRKLEFGDFKVSSMEFTSERSIVVNVRANPGQVSPEYAEKLLKFATGLAEKVDAFSR